MLTQERLKEVLHYDADTGIFTWKVRHEILFKDSRYCTRWNNRYAGTEAGCIAMTGNDGKKYKLFSVFGTLYRAHRIAWLFMTGTMPSDQIDHKDGNGCNNKWENLRCVNNQINGQNVRRNTRNTSGTTGVSWNIKRNAWDCYISVDKKKKNLGRFKNKDSAINARKKADIKYGYYVNHGSDRPL